MVGSEDDIQSPCVRHCCLDQHDVCLGCFRAVVEITGWSAADPAEKRAILSRSTQRRRQYIGRQGGIRS